MDLDERLENEQDQNLMLGPQLPIAPLKRLLAQGNQMNGHRKHIIARGTTEIFREAVEAYAKELATQAAEIAHLNGRFTIRPEDIETVLSYQKQDETIAPDLASMADEAIGGD